MWTRWWMSATVAVGVMGMTSARARPWAEPRNATDAAVVWNTSFPPTATPYTIDGKSSGSFAEHLVATGPHDTAFVEWRNSYPHGGGVLAAVNTTTCGQRHHRQQKHQCLSGVCTLRTILRGPISTQTHEQ
eukprot:m.25230 g.25230  ORF g.25230 m.25230 type:complete len:131 (+) comp6176_c0_seq1:199-591(+)